MNIKNLMLGNITLQDLLNYYNATIIYESWLYKDVRGFVDYYKGYYFIYINSNMSYYKKKKTILHELAHIEQTNHVRLITIYLLFILMNMKMKQINTYKKLKIY